MDQTVFITGATDGLGKAAAHKFAREGADLILHGRSEQRCRDTVCELKNCYGITSIRYYVADFIRLEDIFAMIAAIKQCESRLHVLINNAGIGVEDRRTCSVDGHEKVIQVNYLSTYALTVGLKDLIDENDGRVICVSSSSQATVDFKDPDYIQNWNGVEAYGRSKWAQAAFAIARARRLGSSGPALCAVHPGSFMPTKLVVNRFPVQDSIEDGVDAIWNLAVIQEPMDIHGRYFDKKSAVSALESSYDEDVQERLFDMSERMLAGARLSSPASASWESVC